MPMDALSPHDPCQEVICKFSSQTGKTEIVLNFLGYIIDQDPGPTLVIQPNTKPMGEAFSKDRISPMLRDSPAITKKVAASKGRDSANTMLHKTFPGGHLTIGGANSPAGLASRPIRYLAFDEIDRYEVTKEGDSVSLAQKRDKTFHNRKRLKTSTPTYADMGIDAEYQIADQQFEWHLTCHDCGKSQMPALKHFVWPKDEPEDAVYTCEHCGVSHDFDMESRIKATGQWIQTKSEGFLKKSFWMNQWASPFGSWAETIREFLDAQKDPTKLQAVVNTAFAECWEEGGETLDPDALISRREVIDKVPEDALVLVAAVDVQDDRFEMEVIGYGEGEESWGIDRRAIYGDPGQRMIWDDLNAALSVRYETDDGAILHIASTCIDSGGHFTKQTYDFCKGKQSRRIFAIKGVGGEGRAIITTPSAKQSGRDKRKVPLFTVGVDEAKRLVYARLKIVEAGPGYCHFPKTYDEEFFAQLTAETIRTRFIKGFPKKEWIKTRPRNEALDIRAYALAALYILNPVWQALKRATEEKDIIEEPTKPLKRKHSRRGGFVSNWR